MTFEESTGGTAIREARHKTSPANRDAESVWARRVEDWRRHVVDLQNQNYEGAVSRADREVLFRKAFDLVTPVARRVLDDMNLRYLKGTADLDVCPPGLDGEGGLIGSWSLTWPLLRSAKNRFTGEPLEPLAVTAIFPFKLSSGMQWTHPHLALRRPGLIDGLAAAFPFQVLSPEDAERQEPILRVLAEAEFHERFYQSDLNWRLLPFVAE
jgi:hypothetical protein